MSIAIAEKLESEMTRALIFGAVLDGISAPTEAQRWLADAAADLERQRDPEGSKKVARNALKLKLLQRDGGDCWYCDKPLGEDVTLEHLQPLALAGTWAESNLVLAHRGCNKAAGHMSLIKKEHLREEMRGIREGGTYEYLEAMRGGISGSRPAGQAPAGLVAPRVDPGRKGAAA